MGHLQYNDQSDHCLGPQNKDYNHMLDNAHYQYSFHIFWQNNLRSKDNQFLQDSWKASSSPNSPGAKQLQSRQEKR
jgi:hypothetical protein